MSLFIGKRYEGATVPVQSIFRLAGSDEDALTFALGYLLAHDMDFCKDLLKLLRIRNRNTLNDGYSVHLQEVTGKGFGRRDVVIEFGKTRVVIEAKVGSAEPTDEQMLKYSTETDLWEQYDKKWLVALTQVKIDEGRQRLLRSELHSTGIRFENVQWHKVIECALNHKPSDYSEASLYLFNEFNQFVRGDYNMGYYDAEIHIQDVNPLNAEIFGCGWMYVTSLKDKKAPMYFAPYFTKQGPNTGISRLGRVMYSEMVVLNETEHVGISPPTEKHREQWETGYAMLRKRGKDEGWGSGASRVFYFDQPMTIAATPITKKAFNATNPSKQIPNQIPKGFFLRFDQLLPHFDIGGS